MTTQWKDTKERFAPPGCPFLPFDTKTIENVFGLFLILVLVTLATPCLAGLIQPSDLVYKGAFRLPEGSNGSNWEWSGGGMTYYPEGDPTGPSDGYPGSIFGIVFRYHILISTLI